MNDREQILAQLRRAGGHRQRPAAERPRPALAADSETEFIQRMQANHSGVEQLAGIDELPQWMASYIEANDLPPRLVFGHQDALVRLPWDKAGLEAQQRPAEDSDLLALSWANRGIAESGTLLIPSGPDNPATLNFLPDHHIVLLYRGDIVNYWEDAWQYYRTNWSGDSLPRALHFISAPSSTADVGLVQVYGAHGPRNLSVLLLDEP